MLDSHILSIRVDEVDYNYTWHDFGKFYKLRVYKNRKLVGSRELPVFCDREELAVRYYIKMLVNVSKPQKESKLKKFVKALGF